MSSTVSRWLDLSRRHHLWGSLAIVVFTCWVIAGQVADRSAFANSDLHRDVMDRWGAPIVQPAPSVRFVPSGTIFNALHALPLSAQHVVVDARMNYRKRGLVYFSGFDFTFRGTYAFVNGEDRAIDAAFVFPINLEKNKVLLSELTFTVNGEDAPFDLADDAEKLLWTGRLQPREEVLVDIGFHGRGLDSFLYRLDPELPVRDFLLDVHISGGDNFDYDCGVVSATTTRIGGDGVALAWRFASLESGVPVGVMLPSEKSFDRIIATMVERAWVTFLLFFVCVALLSHFVGIDLAFYQTYLIAAAYGFFFVLLAYLAAFMSFYAAFALTTIVIGVVVIAYVRRLLGPGTTLAATTAYTAYLCLPAVAVILENYTGLIYCLEILATLVVLMLLTTKESFASGIARLIESQQPQTEGNSAPAC